jgi:hypothetical protein
MLTLLTSEQIAELEAKHGEIAHLVGKGKKWEAVFRAPNRIEYNRFRSQAHDPKRAPDAQEHLARLCVVHPTREEFGAMLEKFPGIPEAAGPKFKELAGMELEDTEK